jgi:hypothetical protein
VLLDGLHLVLETQLQLFQSDFFKFFVFGEVALLSEGFEPLGVLRVLRDQFAEFIVTGQELVSRSHPVDLLFCFSDLKLTQVKHRFNEFQASIFLKHAGGERLYLQHLRAAGEPTGY